jgi:hypothetical protein
MRIDSECSANAYCTPVAGGDRAIERMQKQIDKLEERIRDIMEDEDIPSDTRQKQKEQIELQISLIRQQIMARQRELQQQKMSPKTDIAATSESSEEQSVSMSDASIQAFIGADSAMSQIKAKDGARTDLENKARTLSHEISLDAARGVDVTDKAAALSGIEAKIGGIISKMAEDMSGVHEAFDTAEEIEAEKEAKEEGTSEEQKKEQNGIHIDEYV